MSRHFKIHKELKREDLDRLEAFAREPGRTIDECKEWLEAEGFVVSRSAVHRWKQGFDADDKFRAAAEAARELMAAAASDEKGAVAIADASALKINQMVFEQMLIAQETGAIETKDLLRLAQAQRHAVLGKRDVERVRKEMQDRQAEALAAAEKEAKAGGSADAVIGKVREILGIKA